MKPVQLIGAPTDVGASIRGTSMGPEALRVAEIAATLARNGLQVTDLGNLTGPGNPGEAPVDGMRHLDEVVAWNAAVFNGAYEILANGRMPLLMGGDHCLAIGSISAAARHCRETGKQLLVLWLDAHADANTGSTSPSGNIHGMPVACLCCDGPEPLTTLSGKRPAMQPNDIRQVGIRSVDPEEKRRLRQLGLPAFDMRFIDENGMRETMRQALAGVDANTHLHVSFDVDFLDAQIAPGVGTPVRGGPTYRETHLALEMIADTGALGSLDVLELNPARDIQNQTAELVVELLESLFGKSTLLR